MSTSYPSPKPPKRSGPSPTKTRRPRRNPSSPGGHPPVRKGPKRVTRRP